MLYDNLLLERFLCDDPISTWNQLTLLICSWGCWIIWSSLSSRHRAQRDHLSLLPIRNSRWLEIPKGQSLGRWVCLLGWKFFHVFFFWKTPVEEWLNLKNFFQCRLLCHECKADKDTYMRRTLHAERYTLDEFFNQGLKPGDVCSWAYFWHLF